MQSYLLIAAQKLIDIETAQNLTNLTKTQTMSGAKRTKSFSLTGIAMQKRLAKSIGCSNWRQSQTTLKSFSKFLVKKNLITYPKDAKTTINSPAGQEVYSISVQDVGTVINCHKTQNKAHSLRKYQQ